jgi:hypothetical protein
MEMARAAQVESLTFIKGEVSLACECCPIKNKYNFCAYMDMWKNLNTEDNRAAMGCYGAFMRFLFSEED